MERSELINTSTIAIGLDPEHYATQALVAAARERVVPAIDKPLGPRSSEESAPEAKEVNLSEGAESTPNYGDLGGLRNWNDAQNPWQY